MITFDTFPDGKRRARFMFIGAIRANWLRRLLMVALYPFVVTLTVGINLLMAIGMFAVLVVRGVVTPLRFRHAPWKASLWDTPRPYHRLSSFEQLFIKERHQR
jgi:hypothetical protein